MGGLPGVAYQAGRKGEKGAFKRGEVRRHMRGRRGRDRGKPCIREGEGDSAAALPKVEREK